MLNRFLCETCGGALNKVDEAHYACRCCGNVYSVEKIENYADKISKLFDGAKLELIANAKKNLYNAITSQYISSEEVHECCSEIKKYLPDDFQANFYDDFINKPKREVPKKIREINVNEHFECS